MLRQAPLIARFWARVASEHTVWTAAQLADCKHSSRSTMSTVSDNDDAPQPNHALVASLLPTIRPPKALETDNPLNRPPPCSEALPWGFLGTS